MSPCIGMFGVNNVGKILINISPPVGPGSTDLPLTGCGIQCNTSSYYSLPWLQQRNIPNTSRAASYISGRKKLLRVLKDPLFFMSGFLIWRREISIRSAARITCPPPDISLPFFLQDSLFRPTSHGGPQHIRQFSPFRSSFTIAAPGWASILDHSNNPVHYPVHNMVFHSQCPIS